MRKVYNLLALVMLLFTSVSAVQAQNRYQVKDQDVTTPLTADQIETGVNYVLQNGSISGNQIADYVKGTAKSSLLTDDNLYQFVDAGTSATTGEQLYRLKRVATGEYLENNNGSISYSTSESRGWKFLVLAATTVSQEELDAEEPTITDFSCVTTSTPIADGIILYDADGQKESKNGGYFFCTNGESQLCSFSKSNYSSNVLCIYEVEQLTGYGYVEACLSSLGVSEGVTEKYNAGTEPGNISQELYDEMVAAYDACNELITSTSDDHEACVAAVERLEKALAAAKAGVILVKEGYYYFGGRRTAMDENNHPTNATYDDGSMLSWTYGSTWTQPEVLDIDNAKYVWQIIQAGTDESTGEAEFYIRNLYTQRYIGVAKNRGDHVASTEQPEEAFYIYPRTKDDFSIESVTLRPNPVEGWNGVECTALHQAGDHNGVVVWSPDAEASGWIFLNVSQEEVDAVMGLIDQNKLNEKAESLIDKADASYQAGFAYPLIGGKESGEIDNEEDGTPSGLVTKISQVSTNSLETSEGSMDALLDSDIQSGNFYHSIWSSSTATEAGFDNTTTYPYLQFDLEKAVQEITVKMWPRRNGENLLTNNLPGKVHVLATNGDPTEDDSWVEIGNFNTELKWKYISTEGTTTSSNAVGALRLSLGAAYRYVRLEVCTRYGSTSDFKSLGLGAACFNMGELRVFESAYSAEASLNSAVPEDVINAFTAAMEKLQAELDAESATQATIDELQAAYDAYLENYPDPDLAVQALTAAQSTHDAAEEGEELGYYADGSKAELQAALDAAKAKIKDVMTVAEVKAVREEIAAALATFGTRLNVPTDGGWYYIVSKTADGAAANAYVRSAGNGVARNVWTKMDSDDNFSSRLSYYWQFIKNSDGTYSLKNAENGEYLLTPRKTSQGAGMSTKGDTCNFSLVSPQGGIFNIVMAESVYLNADPAGVIVTWGSASGTDNSAFAFEEADVDGMWDGSLAVDVAANKVSIVTLPISVKSDGYCYSVIGRNGEKLELATIEEGETIEAGTPFFYVEESGESVALLDAVETSVADMTYATEAKTVNGLTGTLAPIAQLNLDYGILYNNETIVNSRDGDGVAHNSGYIIPSVPTTTETGAKQVAIDGTIDAINTVAPAVEAAVVNVYTLSGVKVRANVKSANATNGLPAGLYIVGQKKVLVK